jgi:hypothetical protein
MLDSTNRPDNEIQKIPISANDVYKDQTVGGLKGIFKSMEDTMVHGTTLQKLEIAGAFIAGEAVVGCAIGAAAGAGVGYLCMLGLGAADEGSFAVVGAGAIFGSAVTAAGGALDGAAKVLGVDLS